MFSYDALRFLRLMLVALVATVILVAVVLPAGIAAVGSYRLLNAACGRPADTLADRLPALPVEAVMFQGGGDFTLNGWYIPGDNGAGILLAPGAGGHRDVMVQEAEFLHAAGYSVLSIDTRTCADPPQSTTLGYAEMDDIRAALDALAERPEVERIGILGFSMGGASALMLAPDEPRIGAVVAMGNYARLENRMGVPEDSALDDWTTFFRLALEIAYEQQTGIPLQDVSPLARMDEISPRAVFLIYGTDESYTSGEALYEAAGEPRQFWLVEGVGHGGYHHNADYPRRIISFFDEHLSDTNTG